MEDESSANQRTASINFQSFTRGNASRGTPSNAWKKQVADGSGRLSTLIEISQAAKKVFQSESAGDAVETVAKTFITVLEAEKSAIGKMINGSKLGAKALNSPVGQSLRNSLRKMPAVCLAITAYDCAEAYGPEISSRRNKRSQIRRVLNKLYIARERALIDYHLADLSYRLADLSYQYKLLNQELVKSPFFAIDALLDAFGTGSSIDGESVAEILIDETNQFFEVLKRSVDPKSERGARLSYHERNNLIGAAKNRSSATLAISFLSSAIDQFVNSDRTEGLLASFARRVRNLNALVSNSTLDNIHHLYGSIKNMMVDSKYSVILNRSVDGMTVYAAKPIMASGPKPFFITFVPLPSGYNVTSAVRVSRSPPTTEVYMHKFPEGIAISDVHDYDDLTYFFKVEMSATF
jgi:hypothetical protein